MCTMQSLCKYSNSLGIPNEGIHATRLGGFAMNDIVMTCVLAIVTSSTIHPVRAFKHFVLWMLVAVIMHRMFCVNTALNKLIFGIV